MLNYVVKSDGEREKFSPDKLNKMAQWADNVGVNWSEVVLSAVKKVSDECTTQELQDALISSCAEKQTTEHINMAARLFLGTLYKKAHGGFENRPHLYDFYYKMVIEGVWEQMDYDADDLEHINELIDHDKDLSYKYTTVKQISDKYSKKLNGTVCETPQFTFIGIAMKVMESQPEDRRLDDIEKLYNYLSDLKINMPTPFLSGLRTPFKGYASCAVFVAEDDAKSLGISDFMAYTMTCASAGIGGTIRTRSKGDKVKGGAITHTGKLPYYRSLQGSVKSTKQSIRGGSATIHYTCLDPEVYDLLRLRHPTTVSEKQVNGLDYSLGVNKFFMEKVAKDEKWMLVSLGDGRELHDSLYKPLEYFIKEYEAYEKSDKPRTYVSAKELAELALINRQDTGRGVYIHWLDEMNTHTSFKDPIYSSNLCKEIFLRTKPYYNMTELYDDTTNPDTGEMALCFLSSIVAGRVTSEEYEDVAYYTCLAIDNVIDIMEYPFEHLKRTAQATRSIGVGITNLAHYMAKNKKSYCDVDGKNFIHRHAEMHSFFLHKASVRLAQEKGACEWMYRTKYNEGWLPIDTYNKNVDSVHTQSLMYPWEEYRGLPVRFSVNEATAPYESSSGATATTNSLYPIRSYVVIKKSGTNKIVFDAPDIDDPEVKEYYELAWDIDTKHMIDVYSIVQKFSGQGISADFYKDYSRYPNEKIPVSELIGDALYATKMGMKSWYYQNARAGIKSLTDVPDTINIKQLEVVNEEDSEDDCEACKM